ncbi:MAG: 4-(cytidine 5'-diphospho)-2-C-methyl-D-erythritol kinase [Deltaproteobacteria bacterium]|nr:4-(cytidine 5'-diphospho)-2-C-methyl-D-erythritol kinase [Deltaproteobacteria bacterium]
MISSELEILAPAKINLVLRVGSRRADGYHGIETAMQKLALADCLSFKKTAAGCGVELRCSGAVLPEDENNLVFKAALVFFDYTGISGNVEIHLEKRIPVAAGLGGGSSDAAAALSGLNSLFGTNLSLGDLRELGASLGADVPFFIGTNAAAFATGIGTTLKNIEPLGDCWIVLVNPGIPVSTKWVYDNFRLTTGAKPYMLPGCSKSFAGELLPGMPTILAVCNAESPFNDLEAVTARRYGVIQSIKEELAGQGACLAMMSGSGPTVFGIFRRRAEAAASYTAFRELYSGVFLTQPVS